MIERSHDLPLWRQAQLPKLSRSSLYYEPRPRASLGCYLDFYNRKRPHLSLDRGTPDRAYFEATIPQALAARIFRRRSLFVPPVGLRPLCGTNRLRRNQPADLHLPNADTCPNKPGHLSCDQASVIVGDSKEVIRNL